MELCFNALNIWIKNIALLVLLVCSQVWMRSERRVPICKTNKIKNNCDPDSLSFLWTIKRSPSSASSSPPPLPSPVSYFFGTIHVPYSRVWDSIPSRVKLAFRTSDNIFFELDLMDGYTVSTLSSCQLLPRGVKLIDILPADLYRRLKRHLDYVRLMLPSWMTPDQRARGLYAEYLYNAITGNWERKRPVWVMLMVNSLTENDIKSRGVPVLDLFLAQEAQRLNKKIGSVEKVEEQCIPLNGLNYSQVVFALNQTLYQHEGIRRGILRPRLTTDDLIRHYNCGNLNEIIFNSDTTHVPNIMNNSFNRNGEELEFAQHIDHYFRTELIVKRNKRMSERVVNILRDNPNKSYFFAFGAGHFLGNDSILDFIKENGFEINRVSQMKTKNPRFRLRCRSQQNNRHKSKNNFKSDSILSEDIVSQKNSRNIRPEKEIGIDSEKDNLIYLSNRKTNHKSENKLFVPKSDTKDGDSMETMESMPDLISSPVKSTGLKERPSLHKSNTKLFSNGYWDSGTSMTSKTTDTTSASASTTTSFSMYSSHYSLSRQQENRRFNDLWVRLETVTTKQPLLRPRQQTRKDIQFVNNYLRVWYSSATSRSTSSAQFILFSCHSSLKLILISYIYIIFLFISHLKTLIL